MGLKPTTIRFTTFPRTEPSPDFIENIISVFKKHEATISTTDLRKGLTSDQVLSTISLDLADLKFQVEIGKQHLQKIQRPVFFGENGLPELRYQIDAYQPQWNCGLEVEAGRAWMGNAFYRDLVQALVMVQVDHLCTAVPNAYKYNSGGRPMVHSAYESAVSVADALYGHSRIKMPYRLTVIGY
jgi:hypothetical protein